MSWKTRTSYCSREYFYLWGTWATCSDLQECRICLLLKILSSNKSSTSKLQTVQINALPKESYKKPHPFKLLKTMMKKKLQSPKPRLLWTTKTNLWRSLSRRHNWTATSYLRCIRSLARASCLHTLSISRKDSRWGWAPMPSWFNWKTCHVKKKTPMTHTALNKNTGKSTNNWSLSTKRSRTSKSIWKPVRSQFTSEKH